MKTQIKKFWLIIKAFIIIILECLIITLPIYLDLPIYVGVVISNILTFMLALTSANIFCQLGRQLSEPDTESEKISEHTEDEE